MCERGIEVGCKNNLGRAKAESYVVFHDAIRTGSELCMNVELK